MSTPRGQFDVVQPVGWPRPKGYSNALRVPAGRDLLFLAGQVGWDEQEHMVGDDFLSQFRQALENVVTLVSQAGGRCEDIVRMTIYCVDTTDYLADPKGVGAVYREVIGRHYPVMSLVRVAGLIERGALLEIEATAALPVTVGDD